VEWDTFIEQDEPEAEQWQCPCPECNGYAPLLAPDPDEDEGAWAEPSAEAMTPSEWVWAE
jgi:hypothetical protein